MLRGNGGDSVKAVSDMILPSCADDGVAWYIENVALNQSTT